MKKEKKEKSVDELMDEEVREIEKKLRVILKNKQEN